ncbi:MAG: Asp-tRNA(Asn)/Glu-tRNA(Gln) amidotransferase subunit GatB [Fibrobacter sp.]|nr:Asp-tRNA(Asn)/Glu-tRNA(Gln) amidotransferase subunit GatB [Fibrobacter sp.]
MSKYYPVIGLEVHAQLKTQTKLFCSCSTEFGATPNSNVCPGCLGLPGSLPVPNNEAVRLAIRLGLALNCEIELNAQWTRKNYFYPDIPAGYQTTQIGGDLVFDHPIAKNGWLEIELEDGSTKRIGITRIHMEEDAGKLIHDLSPNNSHFDANRCGTPLCEIVSEPDIRSPQEAVLYLQKLKQILEYTDTCDANMEEGNLRCDANVSIRPSEDAPFGTRSEIKNLNSFSNLEKAVEAEISLQAVTIDSGHTVEQCTKRYDVSSAKTITIRSKEDAQDYRYIPDPNLARMKVSPELIKEIGDAMPELPDQRRERFVADYEITPYDSIVLTMEKDVSEWFDQAAQDCKNPKLLANWVITDLLREVKDQEGGLAEVKIQPKQLAAMVNLIEDKTISGKIGKTVFDEMLKTGEDPAKIIEAKGLVQITDPDSIEKVVREVIAENPSQFEEFKGGKMAIKGFFVGQTMRKTGGKANPGMVNQILDKIAQE